MIQKVEHLQNDISKYTKLIKKKQEQSNISEHEVEVCKQRLEEIQSALKQGGQVGRPGAALRSSILSLHDMKKSFHASFISNKKGGVKQSGRMLGN